MGGVYLIYSWGRPRTTCRTRAARDDCGHQNDTHCKNGHPWDESNTYWYRGRRSCRACNRANVAKRATS